MFIPKMLHWSFWFGSAKNFDMIEGLVFKRYEIIYRNEQLTEVLQLPSEFR